jgi:hypothetical protein
MKLRLAVLSALLFVAVAAQAQTPPPPAEFTFAGTPPLPNGTTPACSAITSWNGDSTIYPEDRGAICLYQGSPSGGYGAYLSVPWQLGFLNNGFLEGCDPLKWDSKVFTIGNGTHAGDAFTVAGSTTCPYYVCEYGCATSDYLVGWSVVASYTVIQRKSCNLGRCVTYLTNVLTGGTGTVEETALTAFSHTEQTLSPGGYRTAQSK